MPPHFGCRYTLLLILGRIENSPSEDLRPATCSRDLEIQLQSEFTGFREQVAERRLADYVTTG